MAKITRFEQIDAWREARTLATMVYKAVNLNKSLSSDADQNLLKEGVPKDKIHRVGNIMIDSLEMLRDKIEAQHTYADFSLQPNAYGLVTLHRPSNVDDPQVLSHLCEKLVALSNEIKLVFPVHPRTRKNLAAQGLIDVLASSENIILLEPLNYIRFMNLVFHCRLVITDSGGIQEETSYLGIPCLTLRPNTERPITITMGTNQLCKVEDVVQKATEALSNGRPKPPRIDLWDGKTAQRVVDSIKSRLLAPSHSRSGIQNWTPTSWLMAARF